MAISTFCWSQSIDWRQNSVKLKWFFKGLTLWWFIFTWIIKWRESIDWSIDWFDKVFVSCLLGLSLHLYVNGKPCGHPDVVRSEPLNNSNVSRAEPFRLYEKCARGKGESARPLAAGKCEQAVLRIMSCCDKLQKRCFLGIQGHFLSQLILPIYLGAIVVGKEWVTD